MGHIKDLTGKRFGRLIVICIGNRLPGRNYAWLCLCSCGNYKIVRGTCLKTGDTKSCGCLRVEKLHIRRGKEHPSWKGGINKSNGKVYIKADGHHKADKNGYVRKCVLVAEKALGKPFPLCAVVHHVDSMQDNDKNNNLVLCENDNYHKLLHRRERAYHTCGNPNFRKCWLCKTYDSVDNLYIPPKNTMGSIRHRKCMYEYNKRLISKKEHKQGALK